MSRTRTRNVKVREWVRLRANRLCELCGKDVNCRGQQTDPDFPTMHHRWPRRHGGLDHVDNLLYLCAACHTHTVHEDEDVAHMLGWMATKDTYRGTAVLCHMGWVVLTEDGQYEALSDMDVLDLNLGHALNDNKRSAA